MPFLETCMNITIAMKAIAATHAIIAINIYGSNSTYAYMFIYNEFY